MTEFSGSPLYCVFKRKSPISCDLCVYMYGMCIYVWYMWYDVCVCVGTHMPQCLGEGQKTISSFIALLSTCCETGSLDHCCMDLTFWPKSFQEIFLLLLPISVQEYWDHRCVLPCWLSTGSCWDYRCVLPCWLSMGSCWHCRCVYSHAGFPQVHSGITDVYSHDGFLWVHAEITDVNSHDGFSWVWGFRHRS